MRLRMRVAEIHRAAIHIWHPVFLLPFPPARIPFDDALEAVGTAASVNLIKERIRKAEASPDTIRSWIGSLTFIPKPDLPLMQTAVDILKERVNYPEILLTFSTLAHSYCRSVPDCSSHRPIDILSRLYKKFFLHTGCATRQAKDVDQVIGGRRASPHYHPHPQSPRSLPTTTTASDAVAFPFFQSILYADPDVLEGNW